MKCLRIYITDVDTGKSLRKVRIPLAIIRLVAQLLPPRIFELLESDIDRQVGKEVAQRRNDEIEDGLIVDMEEYNEEYGRTEYTVIFVE